MPETTDLANTPRYILRSGNQSVAPKIKIDDPDAKCVCVYGFSDKSSFDRFNENTDQPLAPYPLTQGYLANQIAATDTSGADTAIVILNATGLKDSVLLAATMTVVLDAQQEKTKQVKAGFKLAFDPDANEYRFESSGQ